MANSGVYHALARCKSDTWEMAVRRPRIISAPGAWWVGRNRRCETPLSGHVDGAAKPRVHVVGFERTLQNHERRLSCTVPRRHAIDVPPVVKRRGDALDLGVRCRDKM